MFYYLPEQETQLTFEGAKKLELFKELPTELKREHAITIANKFGIKPITANNLLKTGGARYHYSTRLLHVYEKLLSHFHIATIILVIFSFVLFTFVKLV